jgi:hypothetical protein
MAMCVVWRNLQSAERPLAARGIVLGSWVGGVVVRSYTENNFPEPAHRPVDSLIKERRTISAQLPHSNDIVIAAFLDYCTARLRVSDLRFRRHSRQRCAISALVSDTPKTGLVCPSCKQPGAVIDNMMPGFVVLHCAACGNRWSAREPGKSKH